QDEPHRAHEVRSDRAHQVVALDCRLPRDAQLAGGDVAEPSMRELARPAAGAGGEIVLLDQRHRQPACGGVESHTGTSDTAAYNQYVDDVVTQRSQVARAP